jgi:hypothetical protein
MERIEVTFTLPKNMGTAKCLVLTSTEMYVSVERENPIRVNGIPVCFSLRYELTDGVWDNARGCWRKVDRTDKMFASAPDGARHKVLEIIRDLVRDLARTRPELLKAADRADALSEIRRKKDEIAETEKKLAALRVELQKMEMAVQTA